MAWLLPPLPCTCSPHRDQPVITGRGTISGADATSAAMNTVSMLTEYKILCCWKLYLLMLKQVEMISVCDLKWGRKTTVPCCFSLLPLELGGADVPVGGSMEPEPRLSHTPSVLESALSQENPGVGVGPSDGSISHTPWPAAPDITRETRNNLRDNGLREW